MEVSKKNKEIRNQINYFLANQMLLLAQRHPVSFRKTWDIDFEKAYKFTNWEIIE